MGCYSDKKMTNQFISMLLRILTQPFKTLLKSEISHGEKHVRQTASKEECISSL